MSEQIVLRLAHQARQPADLVVDGVALRAEEQADLAIRKIAFQLLEHRQRGVVRVDAEDDFVFAGIILTTEAGVIFVRVFVQSADRLQAADGRKEIRVRRVFAPLDPEISDGTEDYQQVIDAGNGGDRQDNVARDRQSFFSRCTVNCLTLNHGGPERTARLPAPRLGCRSKV